MTSAVLRSYAVLSLPGWMSSGPGHWQSRWEALHGFQRVDQDDWSWPRRGDWMARLDETLLATPLPVVLVAHSLGTQLVAAWAAHSRHTARVVGALLVAPADTERVDTPPQLATWRPIARGRLPFDSLVVASEDDCFCTLSAARQLASDWGSDFVSLGACGHINEESGLGDWPHGIALLQALVGRAKR